MCELMSQKKYTHTPEEQGSCHTTTSTYDFPVGKMSSSLLVLKKVKTAVYRPLLQKITETFFSLTAQRIQSVGLTRQCCLNFTLQPEISCFTMSTKSNHKI